VITTKLDGWKETAKALQELPARAQKAVITKSLRDGGRIVAEAAKQSVAFGDRTGMLRKAIGVVPQRAKPGVISVLVKAWMYYAKFIEKGWSQKTANGTRHIPGKWFLRGAFEASRDKVLTEFEKSLREFIRKKLTKLKR